MRKSQDWQQQTHKKGEATQMVKEFQCTSMELNHSNRRKDEMTIENGGVEPNMLTFIEDVYKSKKSGKIVYKKAKQIVETLKEQVHDLQSKEPLEDGSVQPIKLSCSEINDLVRKAIPKKKGHRFGFGSLPDHEKVNSPFLPSLDNDKKLEEAYNQISELVKEKEENTKTIQYLKDVTEKLLNKFPDCRPPEEEEEDDDETQN
ncbi:PREDICTED: uncharacterized protein LOC104724239 [Camelina sativa]|uniref:Uncharacterized protein LOC104724239 n=1 Tax=Camelina sativa TaxID=90675 RepID=A0ABM0UGY7_CAMSA|nr:PREDICTED: uncharacterized protein LOC104724239 [Camelina sativa]